MKVKLSHIHENSLVKKYLPAGYSDAYQCTFINDKNITPDDLMISFWTTKPDWVETLFKIRNALVKPFGLKTDSPDNQSIENGIRNGTAYGLTSVTDKADNETIILMADKHLNAYLSLYFQEEENNLTTVYVSTVVHFNNTLGYLYFYPIMPFHHMVVKHTIASSIKRLINKQSNSKD